MKIFFMLMVLVVTKTYSFEGASGLLDNYILDKDMPSNLTDDTSISISIKRIKKGAIGDSGSDAEFYLNASIKPFNMVFNRKDKNTGEEYTSKISEYNDKELADSPVVSLSDDHRSKYKHLKKENKLIFSGKELNNLLAEYPNPNYANFQVKLYEDDLIGDDLINDLKIQMSDIKHLANKNPFGFSREFIFRGREGTVAIVEIKVSNKSDKPKTSVTGKDPRTRISDTKAKKIIDPTTLTREGSTLGRQK